jgi:hypothetical protein
MEYILVPTILVVGGAIIVAALWVLGVNRRARMAVGRDDVLARLGEITGQLAEVNERLSRVERILKDAE